MATSCAHPARHASRALSADALVLSPARALRINMCAEGPTVASSPDVSRAMIKDGFKEMNWSIAVFATWKPKLKAAFAEEEVKRKKVHGEMTDMHDWWCDGDGKSNWEGKEHAAEDEDLCKKWDTHLKHDEPEKRTKPETPPAPNASTRQRKFSSRKSTTM